MSGSGVWSIPGSHVHPPTKSLWCLSPLHASSALTFTLQEQGAWPKKWLSEEVTPLTQLFGSDVCESSTDVRAN